MASLSLSASYARFISLISDGVGPHSIQFRDEVELLMEPIVSHAHFPDDGAVPVLPQISYDPMPVREERVIYALLFDVRQERLVAGFTYCRLPSRSSSMTGYGRALEGR